MRVRPNKLSKNKWIQTLLPALRTTEAARRELRWIKEELSGNKSLAQAVKLRGTGYPLQYILGTQPFGPLSIQTARGVLIPRWETEEWSLDLGNRIAEHFKSVGADPASLKAVDMCTGTGCVLFLLSHMLNLTGTGIDISPRAQRVFSQNKKLHDPKGNTRFRLADITSSIDGLETPDIVTANPPYILKSELRDTDVHVRAFEPRLALVGDNAMYTSCVERVFALGARAAVFEVGSAAQIEHSAHLFRNNNWNTSWRNDGAGKPRTIWAWKGSEWSFLK